MSAAGKSNPLAISGLVVLTLIWSYSWIFMKQVTSYIGAFDFTALRCIFGALVLFIVHFRRSRFIHRSFITWSRNAPDAV